MQWHHRVKELVVLSTYLRWWADEYERFTGHAPFATDKKLLSSSTSSNRCPSIWTARYTSIKCTLINKNTLLCFIVSSYKQLIQSTVIFITFQCGAGNLLYCGQRLQLRLRLPDVVTRVRENPRRLNERCIVIGDTRIPHVPLSWSCNSDNSKSGCRSMQLSRN